MEVHGHKASGGHRLQGEGDSSLGVATRALPLHCADRLPAGRPGVLGPTDCLSGPHVAKNAKLWPTLR